MKILVSSGRWRLRLRIPSRLIFTAPAVYCFMKKRGCPLPYQGARALCKEIHRQRKLHPDWNLVEVTGNDSRVTVRL